MTELAHAPADRYGDQLSLDMEFTGAPDTGAPVDISADIVKSDAYQRLAEMRDTAYERHRSGARTIARLALAARQKGEISEAEFQDLFADRAPRQREPQFEDLSTERPARELDHAERAAGEAVRHPWDDEN